MYKKWMLILVTGMLTFQIVGCSDKGNNEPTEVENESAVDNSTADSDNVQSGAEIPELAEDDTPVFFGDADLTIELPRGFRAYQNEEGLYVHKNYPSDLSTISYVISESDEDITQMKQEAFIDLLEADYYDVYGDNVEIHVTEFENIQIDGRHGLRIKFEFEFKGIEYEQLMYAIYNGHETHILNYTQEKDGGWMEDFEKSAASISLRTQE